MMTDESMNDNAEQKTVPLIPGKLWRIVLAMGPGIFCIGYTIGTGSVTSMAKAGSQYGMQLLWVLFLSCLFSWVLMEAYGRFAVVTGSTAIHSFRTRFRFGPAIAVITVVGVVIGQWTALSGLTNLCANAIYEGFRMLFPALPETSYAAVLGLAIAILGIMYAFLLVGRYSFFERILVVFVSIMGLSFIISMFIVIPSPREIVSGFIPRIPDAPGANMMVAAFVGTTMAAPTFVVRPLLMRGKGWTGEHVKEQSRDALFSAIFMFIISGAIMVAATGALYHEGLVIEKVLDMVRTLEPVAGRFAVVLFLFGTISAGLSSIFPIAMVCPLLVADYRSGELDTNSGQFRILAAIACLMGLTVSVWGANPIVAQIATQVAQVFILPVVILGITFLINNKKLMGKHRAGIFLNAGLATSLLFALVISYKGLLSLIEYFSGGGA